MNLSRIRRLVQLIGLLQSGKGQNAESLALACKVSRRTIFRDLDILRQVGVPLLFDDEQQWYRIPATYYLPPTNFTAEEALAVIVLAYEMGAGNRLPFYQAAHSAAMKLENALPPALRQHLQEKAAAVHIQLQPTTELNSQYAVYQRLLCAAAQRRSVRIHYDSFTEARHLKLQLNPYRLLFSRHSWYVIGRSSLHRQVRTFNVKRIAQLEVLAEQFNLPRGFSIERYLGNAWSLIPESGPDEEVLIRFAPLVARNVAEVNWHRTQRTEWNADGTLDFRCTVSGLNEISWWVLGYGDQAEVIAPPKLREIVAGRVNRLAARYNGRTGSSTEPHDMA